MRSGLPVDVRITRPDIGYRDTRTNAIVNLPIVVNGAPVTVLAVNVPGGGNSRDVHFPDVVAGVNPFLQNSSAKRYILNPAAFAIPAPGTFGNLGRGGLHGSGLSQFDLTAHKKFRVTERVNTEFRGEADNIFNRGNFANPVARLNNVPGTSGNTLRRGEPYDATAGGSFGSVLSIVESAVGLGAQRQVQMSLRVNFQAGDVTLHIRVWNQRQLLILTALLAALVPTLFWMTRPFLASFALASVLAVGIAPMNRWLTRRLGHPALTTFLTTFSSVLAAAAVMAFVGVAFTGELRSTYDSLNRRSLEQGGWPQLVNSTSDRIADALSSRLHIDKAEIQTRFTDGLKSGARYVLDHIGTAVGGIASGFFTLIFTAVFLYFMLRHGEELFKRVVDLSPLDPPVTARLLGTILNTVSASVNGVLAVAVAQGLALSFGFWVADVRSPLLWGAVGGVASLVPLLGCPMVWVPVVVAFAFMGVWWKVVFLGIWGSLVVGSIDNIVRPFVVSASTKLHPLLMAIAALGGTYAFGVLGILLGPLVISVAGALINEIQIELEAARAKDAANF